MLERFRLCSEMHWTPSQLDEVSQQEVDDFLLVLHFRDLRQEREQQRGRG